VPLGVRPPELAIVSQRLGLEAWPLDVETVAARIRAKGLGSRRSKPAAPVRSEAPTIVEARDVHFRYEGQEREALAGIDLALYEGEFVAMIGANGSGKSTFAKLIGGLLETGGEWIRWRGRALAALRPRERAAAVGYVFQNPDEQIFAATVEEEIAFGPLQMGCAGEEIASRVRSAVDAVGLGGFESRDPFLLGKGERQKVAVASILALRPELLILDEPTTGLDDREQRALLDVLERLHRGGQTIVVITHVPWVVGSYAERAVLLHEGTVLFDGAVEVLFADEELCRRADFVPPDISRLANRLGVVALDVESFLESLS
jgi:energy-coupling factor transport system ATP-binding protein